MERAREDLLFGVAGGLACRVPLSKLVELDGCIYLYLTVLMVSTLAWESEALVMPDGKQITMITGEAFENMVLKDSSCT